MKVTMQIKKILMINEDHALMGFGSCGLITIVNILNKEVVAELDMGSHYFTNDIIKL